MNLKKIFFLSIIMLAGSVCVRAQNISGIINEYAEVTAVDFCNNLVALATINEAQQFVVGDKVLVIQMNGATIDLTDSPTYGSISSYGNTGNYEVLTIQSINANIITFQFAMLRNYDVAAGAVQLVSVPEYTNPTINATLTCLPWDGIIGGVLIFEASGDVNFAADIDVTGLGFLPGAVYNNAGCYTGGAGFSGYVCSSGNNCGGAKGNGIHSSIGPDVGRGAPSNGGGGGNDHNTGGGGGGNFSDGGLGGQRLNVPANQCAGNNPGIGGHLLTYSNANNQIFMGGAGGNGDQNSNQGTVGGNGGAIVIITANSISGNGQSIINKGDSVATIAQQDGAGGGGAGGTVLLDVPTISSVLNIDLSGGNGGDVDNGLSIDSCFGPGGGGGAGMLWISPAVLPANIILTSNGGIAGITVNANANAACLNSSNGATNGVTGGALTTLAIPESAVLFVALTATACCPETICLGDFVDLTAVGTGTGGVTYAWDNGMTGANINFQPQVSGNYNVVVTDSRGCSVSDQVYITITGASVTVTANPMIINEGSGSVLQALTPDAVSYSWTPTNDLSNPTIWNPVATPSVTTTYCCEIIASNGCWDSACVTIIVIPDTTTPPPPPPPVEEFIGVPNAFSPNGDGINDFFQYASIIPCEQMLELKVFDRWGKWVNGHNYDFSWDGKDKYGKEYPLGVYTFYARIECGAEIRSYKGNVTLVR